MTTAAPSPQPQSSRRTGLIVAIVIALVAVIGVALGVSQGWFGAATGSPSPDPDASVPGIVPADRGVVAEGRAVPVRAVELQVAVPGTVATLPVAEGDRVVADAVLLTLDSTAAQAQVDQAQAGVDAAAAAVAQAEAGRSQARAGVSVAQASVEEAAAAVRAADAARDALPGAASNDQERQANAQVDQARAGLERARASRTQARAQLAAAEAGVDAATADQARAAASLAAAQAALADLEVRAPFAGTVVSVEPVVGDLVQPGVPVVRVADLSGWRFETSDLSETSIARVREGATATITVDGLPGEEIDGTVESVGSFGSSVQGDITFGVVVAPSGDVPEDLRWNMTVTIEIEGEPAG
ncbi:MAG TPA: efflux RND transporter periplasmic adaptor subunit [Candidatus Limnocylindrales bacterium]|nr:efflux RND transporter periplasmic adaptor subunit [Candidatus Limnocylindrales bacterium]